MSDCVCAHVRAFVWVRACDVHVWTCVHEWVRVRACVGACGRTCMCGCVCVHVWVHVRACMREETNKPMNA